MCYVTVTHAIIHWIILLIQPNESTWLIAEKNKTA